MWKRATGSCYMLLSKQVLSQDGRRRKKKKHSSGFVEPLYNEITKESLARLYVCLCLCVREHKPVAETLAPAAAGLVIGRPS